MKFEEWWKQYKASTMPNVTKEEAEPIWDAALENMEEFMSDNSLFGAYGSVKSEILADFFYFKEQ